VIGIPLNYWASAGATILFVALVYLVHRLYRWAQWKLEAWRRVRKEGIAATAAQIISVDKLASRLALSLNLLRWIAIALLFVRFASFLLEQFQETAAAGHWIVDVVLMPFKRIYDSFVAYIPDLFQMLAVVVTTRYLLVLVHKLFMAVESGAIKIRGFYPDWAEPTYKLVRFFIFALALVAIFPYLPGSSSPAFQTVGVFLGVVFSLGSSSVVANTLSGVILTYMRALKVGDRVKIGETFGDVTEKTLLVTRVLTIFNEVVTVPNSVLLSGQIVNYSTMAERGQLILTAKVTIGYDAPWPQVHEALLEAARRTPLVLSDPPPYVLQKALNDYNVGYELNAFVRDAQRSHFIHSDLHKSIQETFDEAGIEILSPMYNTVRQSAAGDTLQRNDSKPQS
jgi:small-conductance mechanosensitive channel